MQLAVARIRVFLSNSIRKLGQLHVFLDRSQTRQHLTSGCCSLYNATITALEEKKGLRADDGL